MNGTSPAIVGSLVRHLRATASPRHLPVMVIATVVVGRTEQEARDLLADYAGCADLKAALAHASSSSLGIDFTRFRIDKPVATLQINAIQSNIAAMAGVAGPA